MYNTYIDIITRNVYVSWILYITSEYKQIKQSFPRDMRSNQMKAFDQVVLKVAPIERMWLPHAFQSDWDSPQLSTYTCSFLRKFLVERLSIILFSPTSFQSLFFFFTGFRKTNEMINNLKSHISQKHFIYTILAAAQKYVFEKKMKNLHKKSSLEKGKCAHKI